jgi:hypothetical protein
VRPIIWLINIEYRVKQYRRGKIKSQEWLEAHMPGTTQKELNKLFENPEVDFAYKFAILTKIVLMTLFYIPILPIGVIISICGLFLTYFIEKYNILRYYKRPDMFNEIICEKLIDYFKLTLLTYASGNYIFLADYYFQRSWALAFLILMCLLCVLPYDNFLKIPFSKIKEGDINTRKYNDVYLDFDMDYQRANPITRKLGYINYLKILKQKNIISVEEFELLSNKLTKNTSLNLMEIYIRFEAMPSMDQIPSIPGLTARSSRVFLHPLIDIDPKRYLSKRRTIALSNFACIFDPQDNNDIRLFNQLANDERSGREEFTYSSKEDIDSNRGSSYILEHDVMSYRSKESDVLFINYSKRTSKTKSSQEISGEEHPTIRERSRNRGRPSCLKDTKSGKLKSDNCNIETIVTKRDLNTPGEVNTEIKVKRKAMIRDSII